MSTITNRAVRSLLCLVVLAAVAAPAYAQPTQEWVATWNGGTDTYVQYGNSVATDAAGNVYVAGYPYSSSTRYDYGVVKYNSAGTLQWARQYAGACTTGYDYPYGLAVNPSTGMVVVTGYGYESDCSGYDAVTVAWDTNGNQLWTDHYNNSGNTDYGRGVTMDSSGNVFIFGYTYTSSSQYDHLVRSFTPTGTVRWTRLYDSGDQDYAAYGKLIDTDAAGNVYYGAYSYRSASSSSYYDYRVTKYSNTGTLQWSQYYNGSGNYYDYAYGFVVNDAGDSWITGYGRPSGSTYYDYITVKYNTNGALQWARYYDGPRGNYYDYARSIAEYNGNVYVTGYGYGSPTSNQYDYCTVAYDGSGNQLWSAAYNSASNRYDYAWGVDADVNGVYVTGYAYPSGSYPDIVTVAYSHSGAQQGVLVYNGAGNYYDYGRTVYADGAGCIYVNGYGDIAGGYVYGIETIKYCGDVGCTNVEARAGGPYTRECTGQPTSFQVDGSRSCDPNDDPLSYSWSTTCPGGYFDGTTSATTYLTLNSPPPCPVNCSVTLTVSSRNGSDRDTTAVTVDDSQDPWFVGLPGSTTVECDSVPPPANVTAQDVCDPDVPTFFTESVGGCLCDGQYRITRTWNASDACNNSIVGTQTISVIDTTPPVIEPPAGGEPLYCIWPPEHEYYCFVPDEFTLDISDNCEDNYSSVCETGEPDIQWWFSSCVSSDPDDANGDGNTLNDCIIDPNGGNWVCVRAERTGEGLFGRSYELFAQAIDDCANVSEEQSMGTIWIPHDSDDYEEDCLRTKDSPFTVPE